ncbi:hypothetical protein ACF0H5_015648 [Mactra antiquata]
MKLYVIIIIVILCITFTEGQYDNPDCVVDKNLEPSAPDNYVDCTGELNVANGKTECCTIETDVGCCEPGGNWKQFKLIGICLGVITVSLAAILIYWFWCRRNEKVAKATEFVTKKMHGVQERYCTCMRCCRKQIEVRKQREVLQEKAKEVGAFELPSESNTDDPTFDNFWRGPMIKNSSK